MKYSICLWTLVLWGNTAIASTTASPRMPFSFVENQGQTDPAVRFIGNGPQFRAWFENTQVRLQQGTAATGFHFVGGAENPRITASQPMEAVTNYFRGTDPGKWRAGLPMYSLIRYTGVWTGIEVRFRADQAHTKAEYIVAPGASVETIRLRFDGEPEIQADGSLLVANSSGEFREDRPFLFQQDGAGRVKVDGGFRKYGDGAIGFEVGPYDRAKELTIDPTILFSGHFGGYSQSTITALAVNSVYNIIAVGWTIGTNVATTGAAYTGNAGGVDAFVAAFSPAGGTLLYCTYLGGSGDDRAFGVAVDSSNNTYVTGWTSSGNFPVANAYQGKLKGARDAFVTKLNSSGSALVYSTYLGGTGAEAGNAIVVDSTNAAIIVGDTTSTNLPVTAGAYQSRAGGGQDVFLAKLNAAGNSLVFLTYYGGSTTEHSTALKRDSGGNLIFGGSTLSTDLPVVSAAQAGNAGGQDAFLGKLTPDGRTLLFSTYLGGTGGAAGSPEQINGIAIQNNGAILVGGVTGSRDFPVKNSTLQSGYGGGNSDGFVSRFSAVGALLASSYVGGSGDDCINAIDVDFAGYIYTAGYTSSADMPTANPQQSASAGGIDAFVAKLKFTSIIYATYLGGSGNDQANAIAVDSLTNVVVGGVTSSTNFPVSGHLSSQTGTLSSFLTKLVPGYNMAASSTPSVYFDVWHVTGFNGILNAGTFGIAGDIPVSGDWDGTGVKRIGVFRNGTWILDINGNGVIDAADRTVVFGQAGDRPVVGDWNGTRRVKLGLFRQGTFILDLSGHLSGVPTGLSDASISFGLPGDLPVVSDWNQTGTTKIGVFRNGLWLVDLLGNQTQTATYTYGQAGDVPVIGDWDGSGLPRIGVYRNGIWILNYLGNNMLTLGGTYELYLAFGGAGYLPLIY